MTVAIPRGLSPFYIGSTFRLPTRVVQKDDDGVLTPDDLTARPVTLYLRRKQGGQRLELAGVDQGEGLALFEADEAITADWEPGEHALELRQQRGEDVVTLCVGSLSLKRGAAADGNDMAGAASPGVLQIEIAPDAITVVYVPQVVVNGGGGGGDWQGPVDALGVRLATAEGKLSGIDDGATQNATDAALRDRATHSGTQAMSTIAGLVDALADKIDDAEKGANGGVATLDVSGKIPTSQLPAIARVDTFVVNSQAAMLALDAQIGDQAVRTDLNKTFSLAAEPATTLANWLEHLTPTDAVLSVNGKTGAVTLVKADIGLGAVNNTADADKPVSTAQQAALDKGRETPWVKPTSGRYLRACTGASTTTSGVAQVANVVRLYPFVPRVDFQFNRLGISVSSGNLAGRLSRVGVYASDADGYPTTLMVEGQDIDCTNTGAKDTSTNDVTPTTLLAGQQYWIAVISNNVQALQTWGPSSPDLEANAITTIPFKTLGRTLTYGNPLPANWGYDPAEASNAQAPAVWFRVA